VARHPMLRLQANGEILQIAASVPGPVLRVLDGASAELPARLAAYEQAQRGMDLRTGRVLQAVLVEPAGRLMIAVHHLAIDGYSWSVLLDDLSLAYAQALRGEVSLPAATASYPHLVAQIARAGRHAGGASGGRLLPHAFRRSGAFRVAGASAAGPRRGGSLAKLSARR